MAAHRAYPQSAGLFFKHSQFGQILQVNQQ